MVCYGISGVINNVHCIPNGMATLKPTKTLKNFRKISLYETFLLPVIQMLDSGITVHYPLDRDNIHCIQWKVLINFLTNWGMDSTMMLLPTRKNKRECSGVK